MMDEVDVAQYRLEGKCEICLNDIKHHKLGCPNMILRGTAPWGQFGITNKKQLNTLSRQLDLFEDSIND